MVPRHLGELASERTLARPDDPAGRGDAVRLGDRGCVVERATESVDLHDEVRIERELQGDDERRNEHDPRTTVGGKAAGEVERVLGLGPSEERHDDAAIADGGRAPGEAPRLPAERAEVGTPHHKTW